jgi:hypothetical protein
MGMTNQEMMNANTPKRREERRLFEAAGADLQALAKDGRRRLRDTARRNFKNLKAASNG